MRLVDNYNYLPGCCWVCRGVAKPIIDMELDLDGHNSPEDVNPSATTRLYLCADCAVEIGRMCAQHRGLELVSAGALRSAQTDAEYQTNRANELEQKLNLIAGAVHGIESPTVEKAGSTPPNDGDAPAPDTARSEPDSPLVRKRGRPRREETSEPTTAKAKPKPKIDTDFVGDL
jgi:hypothetical protein